MDWDLIIGWMGDTAEEGGSSWKGGRRGGAKSSLSANVKFSVTIRLFALLGRCDSEFDVKRSVLSGASGRRGFREAACLYLPLRQIQRCRDLNPPRPGCNHFSVLGQFFELFWGSAPAQVLVEMELLLELEQLGVCVRRPQPTRHSTLTSDCK